MLRVKTIALAGLTGALLLNACSQEASTSDDPAPVEQGGEAEGDVKPGTISDTMLPLESLQSQAPSVQTRPTDNAADVSDDEPTTETSAETAIATQSVDTPEPTVAEPLVPQIAPPLPTAPPPSDDGGGDEGAGGAL